MTTYINEAGEEEQVHGVLHTDLYGDQHDIHWAMWKTGERVVYYGLDPYTPEQARQLAADLIAAADRIENSVFVIKGGKS